MSNLQWGKLINKCLSMELGLIGNNLSMISDFKAKDGLTDREIYNSARKPTYTFNANFHATQCWTCLRRIQRFIIAADIYFDQKEKDNFLFSLLQQAFKGTILDASNCIMGVLAIIQEVSKEEMTSTEDAGTYLSKRFPAATDDFSVFGSKTIDTLALLGAILIQQQGRLRFYHCEDFVFSIENKEGNNLYLVPRELCSQNGLVLVLPYLFVLLIHVAKCLDLVIKYYLLARSDPGTYTKAAEWYAAPEGFKASSNDELPEALAKVYEKHSIDIKLFTNLMIAR
ncbi:MAG: hypothetical protein PHO37_13350 [Kiritimatiellae bacterium]|nr:hypothetical protein [Kiritimatiellia bacterium]